MASKGAVDISSVPPDLPVVRLPVPKLTVQGRYNQNLFLGVLPRFLQGIAERPLPCNYNAIQLVSALSRRKRGFKSRRGRQPLFRGASDSLVVETKWG